MSAKTSVAIDIESKIYDLAMEVISLQNSQCTCDGLPSEMLERTEQLCFKISNSSLDQLQNKLHEQHEKIDDIRTLWKAVSIARTKVCHAQQLIEDSLSTLSGTPDGKRMEGLLRGVKLLEDHLTGDGETLSLFIDAKQNEGISSQQNISAGDLTTAENLLTIISEVPSVNSDLVAKMRELETLCGKANSISDELEQLKPGSNGIDEERLKDMGMLCSQLESSDSTLSEAALTAKLLAHMYEIEQIEEELHAARSRHQTWEKRIGELYDELKSGMDRDNLHHEIGFCEDSPLEATDKPAEVPFSENRVCPDCCSNQVVKNGFSGGKQRYRCKECKSRFSL